MTHTAEWLCTRCGTTNRKLVPRAVASTTDRCMSCKLKHQIAQAARPVRWDATAK